MRLDQYIVLHFGLSRNKAQSLIEGGFVLVDGTSVCKVSQKITETSEVILSDVPELYWVSRSAGKLRGFLDEIDIDLIGKMCLDIGSSTGGFTQILLESGAKEIVCVDVGTDQLHESLRENPVLEVHENTDIRNFHTSHTFNIIVGDISFISLREIIPVLDRFIQDTTDILLLYKPQFEVGREHLRKTGVPKNESIIQESLRDFESWIATQGYVAKRISPAKVIGEAGNQEYMLWMRKK